MNNTTDRIGEMLSGRDGPEPDTTPTSEPEGLAVLDMRPCLLVAVNVSRRGGQSYERENEEKLDATKEGETRTRWTTKKVIDNDEEFKTASSLQHKAKYAATKLGRHTPVGIVVAADKRAEVTQYRDEWRQAFREFNAGSTYSKIDFSCMVFAIRGDNVQELEAVLDELRAGMADLEQAYRSADPGSMRDVVKRMHGFADLLPERVATKMELAIKAAQKRARTITAAEKRMARLQTKINKELGEEVSPEELQRRLEQLSSEVLTADIKERTARFTRLNSEVMEAADKLEEAKTKIDTTPIRVARFAVQRPVKQIDEAEAGDAARLNAINLGARVANAANAAPVDSR